MLAMKLILQKNSTPSLINTHIHNLIFPNYTVRYLKQWVIVDDDDEGEDEEEDKENNTPANIIYEFLIYAITSHVNANPDVPSN